MIGIEGRLQVRNYENGSPATTLAGSLNRAMNPISVSDDDLPF